MDPHEPALGGVVIEVLVPEEVVDDDEVAFLPAVVLPVVGAMPMKLWPYPSTT